eukprot:5774201-Amphidinium_carterae.1
MERFAGWLHVDGCQRLTFDPRLLGRDVRLGACNTRIHMNHILCSEAEKDNLLASGLSHWD